MIKKSYINPDTSIIYICVASHMLAGSPNTTNLNNNTEGQTIPGGGKGGGGDQEAKNYNVWDDENNQTSIWE